MRLFDLSRGADSVETTEYTLDPIETEDTLEDWLHANPEVMLDEQLFIFGRQYSIETGIPDLLALDQYGNVVVAELKVGKSGTGSASEGSILSQPQTYARPLESYTYSQLDEIYQTYRSYIEDGRWNVSDDLVPAEELHEAREQVFGTTLKPPQFNDDQRMVIVAEAITGQTQRNARYLLEQGLNIQCVAVQRFSSDDGMQEFLLTTTPVDYDLKRVQPDRRGQPIYPGRIRQVVDEAFPEIQELVQAEIPEAVFNDFEQRNPRLISNNPDHPDGVGYAVRIRPLTDGDLMISMDFSDDDLLSFVRNHQNYFIERGFKVNQTRSSFRIVYDKWSVESVQDVDDGELLTDVASRYVDLVESGHEFFQTHDAPML